MNIGFKSHLIILGILLILGLFVYGPSFTNTFVWDDDNFIVKNESFKNVKNPLVFFNDNTKFCEIKNYQRSIYRPIRSIIFWTLYKIFGLNPVPFHVLSFLLHLFNSFIVFLIAGRILKIKMLALVTCFLFMISPGISESILCINYMSEPLFTMFTLLALFFLAKERFKIKDAFVVMLFFILGLLSKETALCLVFLFPVVVFKYSDRERFKVNPWIFYFLILVVSGLYLLLRFSATKSLSQFTSGNPVEWTNILYIPLVLFEYLKLLLPFQEFSAWHNVNFYAYSVMAVISGWLILISLIIITYKADKKERPWFFFSFLFAVGLLPVTHIIPISTPMAERFLYFPSIGIFMIVIMIMEFHYETLKNMNKNVIKSRMSIDAIFVIILLVFSAGNTFSRGKLWGNEIVLFKDALKKYPQAAVMNINLGAAYYEEKNYKNALPFILKGIKLGNRNTDNYSTALFLLKKSGRYQECQKLAMECLAYFPNAIWCRENVENCSKHNKK